MIDFEKVKVHIEKLYNRELSSIQCETLKEIIRGDNFYIPRGVEKNFLFNGFSDYMINVESKNIDYNFQSDKFEIWLSLKKNEVFSKGIKPYKCDRAKDNSLYKYFYIQKGRLISSEREMVLREIEVNFMEIGEPKNKYYKDILEYASLINSGSIYIVDFDTLMAFNILTFDKREDKEEIVKNNNLYFFIY